VLEPTKDGVKFVNRMRLTEEDEVSASPIAWKGRIYLTTGARLYCLGDAAAVAAPPSAGDTGPSLAQQVSAATKGPAGEPARRFDHLVLRGIPLEE
jgi:hypothetical protein